MQKLAMPGTGAESPAKTVVQRFTTRTLEDVRRRVAPQPALASKSTDLEAKHDITVTVKGLKGYATQEK